MALTTVRPQGMGFVTGRRNLIINGAMQVAQRGTSAVTVGAGSFVVDRFKAYESTDGAYTIEQSTDAPDGFTTSLKGQVTTADTSIAAGQYAYWPYYVEAQDLQHLSYGTSSAKTLTLSFWVKSSKTGVYTVAVYKPDTTSYMFTHEYTISSANTWENKTITISPTAGSTSFITSSGGAIANDNGPGLILSWNLSFGSTFTGGTSNSWSSNTSHYSTTNAVNWMDSTSNNFYLTGVQLELGENASDFEHRSYGEELALCQRYFYNFADGSVNSNAPISVGTYYSSTIIYSGVKLPVTMRAVPTLVTASGTSYYIAYRAADSDPFDSIVLSLCTPDYLEFNGQTNVSGTIGQGCFLRLNNASAKLQLDAEL